MAYHLCPCGGCRVRIRDRINHRDNLPRCVDNLDTAALIAMLGKLSRIATGELDMEPRDVTAAVRVESGRPADPWEEWEQHLVGRLTRSTDQRTRQVIAGVLAAVVLREPATVVAAGR